MVSFSCFQQAEFVLQVAVSGVLQLDGGFPRLDRRLVEAGGGALAVRVGNNYLLIPMFGRLLHNCSNLVETVALQVGSFVSLLQEVAFIPAIVAREF